MLGLVGLELWSLLAGERTARGRRSRRPCDRRGGAGQLGVVCGGLVRRRNQVDDAWRQVDVSLRRRSELVPSLVETVDGFAGHEQGTLEAVTEARTRVISAHGPADQGPGESALTGG